MILRLKYVFLIPAGLGTHGVGRVCTISRPCHMSTPSGSDNDSMLSGRADLSFGKYPLAGYLIYVID